MTYLLDTNACIALINGRPAGVRHRFQKVLEKGAGVNVSVIVIFELWYGVAKSIVVTENAICNQYCFSGVGTMRRVSTWRDDFSPVKGEFFRCSLMKCWVRTF